MPLLLSLFLTTAPAVAADLHLEVGGDIDARSVIVMSQDAEGEVDVKGCRDDGQQPDASPDGIWTCEALDAAVGEALLAVAVDGNVTELGGAQVDAAGSRAQVFLAAGRAVLDPSGDLLEPKAGASATAFAPLVLLVATGDWSDGAPMLQLDGPYGHNQAGCRDDGTFPDRVRNDGELACASAATGASIEMGLQPAGAKSIPLGTFEADLSEPVNAFSFTAGEETAVATRLEAWPWPEAAKVVADPVPPPDPVPVDFELAPVEFELDPVEFDLGAVDAHVEGGAKPPTPVGTREGAAPKPLGGSTDPSGRGLVDLLAVLGALGVGFGLAWVVGPRRNRLPPGIRQLEGAPILEGGPRLSDGVVVFQTDATRAFITELVGSLAERRTVLLVGDTDIPAPTRLIYRAEATDWEEVATQIQGLLRATGAPLAVVVAGRDTLTSTGSIADDPARLLADALPAGTWAGFVVGPEGPPIGALPTWTASHDGRWKVART